MENYRVALSEEAQLLNRYLSQYKSCIKKKRRLEQRRKDILSEFNSPLSGVSYDGMPTGDGTSAGSAALSLKLDDIDTRIKGQLGETMNTLIDIIEIINLLPDNSREGAMERVVIERRYIDLYSWKKICREESISRTPATEYWRRGLYRLLKHPQVQRILREYASKEGL